MRVKNVSSRLHHVGSVSIVPGATETIPDTYKNSINKDELVEVKAVAPAPAPAPGTPAAKKAAAIAAAEKELEVAKASGDEVAIKTATEALSVAKG